MTSYRVLGCVVRYTVVIHTAVGLLNTVVTYTVIVYIGVIYTVVKYFFIKYTIAYIAKDTVVIYTGVNTLSLKYFLVKYTQSITFTQKYNMYLSRGQRHIKVILSLI